MIKTTIIGIEKHPLLRDEREVRVMLPWETTIDRVDSMIKFKEIDIGTGWLSSSTIHKQNYKVMQLIFEFPTEQEARKFNKKYGS
jgi:hypothetical protein